MSGDRLAALHGGVGEMTLIEAAVKDAHFRGLSEALSQVRVLKQLTNLTELGPESWERIRNRAGALETPPVASNAQFIAVPRELVVLAIDALAESDYSPAAGELQEILEQAR